MNTEYSLYLDMDGVLVGFDGWHLNPKTKDLVKNGSIEEFWSNLGWEVGGKEVYNAAKRLFRDVYILSSTGAMDEVAYHEQVSNGKMQWIKNHNLDFKDVYFVSTRHHKQKYASPMSILVDDVDSTIKEWNTSGGTGVLHNSKSYQDTIIQLEEFVKPIRMYELLRRGLR